MLNVVVPVADKYGSIIEAEAKARRLTIEQLFLTSIADYIPRGAKSPEGRLMPLNIHMQDKERDEVVAFATAAGETVNHYVRRATSYRVFSEKKQGKPWVSTQEKARIRVERKAGTEAAKLAVEPVGEAEPVAA